jgi:hypothetical protein
MFSAESALFFLRTSKNYLSTKAWKSLYYSMFHSVLICCIQIWSNASPSNFACLKLKQKAAVRIVLVANYDLTEPIFQYLNILPLDALCKFFHLQFTQAGCGSYLFNLNINIKILIGSDEWFCPFSLIEPLVERRAFERRAKREIQKMNAWASAIQGKKLSGERIANLGKMSECPALLIR